MRVYALLGLPFVPPTRNRTADYTRTHTRTHARMRT
jgi:hypothetical protein